MGSDGFIPGSSVLAHSAGMLDMEVLRGVCSVNRGLRLVVHGDGLLGLSLAEFPEAWFPS